MKSREIRALLLLLPVLAVVSWLVWEISRVGTPTNALDETTEMEEGSDISRQRGADARLATEPNEEHTDAYVTNSATSVTQQAPVDHEKFVFDPNTVTYHDLVRLGFTRGEALGIVKYRERGKIFEIPEDFAACYQVSEEMYRRLEPYIRIGEKYRLKPFAQRSEVAGSANRRSLGVSERGFVNLSRNSREDDVVQGDALSATETHPKNIQTRLSDEEVRQVHPADETRPIIIELNTADSAALISVNGIGPRTVVSIMEYRARLGGFARVEQLAEVRGVTEQNYERMIEQIFVDDSAILKIDINFAPAKQLAAHPYIGAEALRKLLKYRQLKGGWRSIEELEADDIFTTEELAKLGPYLSFN